MVDLLQLGRTHGYARLREAMKALALGGSGLSKSDATHIAQLEGALGRATLETAGGERVGARKQRRQRLLADSATRRPFLSRWWPMNTSDWRRKCRLMSDDVGHFAVMSHLSRPKLSRKVLISSRRSLTLRTNLAAHAADAAT